MEELWDILEKAKNDWLHSDGESVMGVYQGVFSGIYDSDMLMFMLWSDSHFQSLITFILSNEFCTCV